MARTTFSVHLKGMESLHKMLTDIAPNEARNIIRNTVQNVAALARDLMKTKVKHRTGRLEKSIKAIRRRGQRDIAISNVRVGATAPYGLILEYGTRHTQAQPYITPTVEELTPKLAELYREQFGKQLERVLARRAKRAVA